MHRQQHHPASSSIYVFASVVLQLVILGNHIGIVSGQANCQTMNDDCEDYIDPNGYKYVWPFIMVLSTPFTLYAAFVYFTIPFAAKLADLYSKESNTLRVTATVREANVKKEKGPQGSTRTVYFEPVIRYDAVVTSGNSGGEDALVVVEKKLRIKSQAEFDEAVDATGQISLVVLK